LARIEDISEVNQIQGFIRDNPNGVIVTDKNSIITYINQRAQKLFFEEDLNLIGKELFSVMPLFQQVDIKNDVIHSITIDGLVFQVVFLEITVNGNKSNVYLVIKLKKEDYIDKALKCKQEVIDEMNEILEGSYDGILVTDANGKILYVNKSYERVAAIKREDMWGKNMRDLINPVWMPNAVSFVVAEQKQVISKKQVTKDGRNIIVTGTPIFDQKGEVKKIVINARDISEIYELREELIKEREINRTYLENYKEFIEKNMDGNPFLAVSEPIQKVYELAKKVANFQTTVLVLGESGAGKEIVANCIYNNSLRKNEQFITINCGAIPGNLLESELFGYEKGAFTGASQSGKEGLFEIADGGTVFLDEVGEISLDLQVKLLRFLETQEIRRVGGIGSKSVDVRIIAATNKDLSAMVEAGKFREDLYYRLNVVNIKVPPLRKRITDIAPLSFMFLNRFNKKYNQSKELTIDVIREFEKYYWPGNIRELRNVVENMVIMSDNEYLQIEDIPWIKEKTNVHKVVGILEENENLTLTEATEILERAMLEKAKQKYGKTREMGEKLGVDQSTIVRKLKKYGL
jgi:PAS domain S-box-containing protein/TyrR family helix-turn-helix protein